MVTSSAMRLRRLLVVLVVFLVIIALVTSAISYYLYRRPLPQTEGAVGVEGLRETVSIYRDEWGVPHIYAATPQDLFFAQGYVHAQDRWWQMEINRHIGKGELSQILGNNETVITSDQLIRTVGWPRIAQKQLDNASMESKQALRAYSAGINYYISDRNPTDLAMQYTILGLAGGGFDVMDWQPIDSLAWATVMNWHWDGNLADELDRAKIYGTLDKNLVDAYFPEVNWQTSVIQAEDLPFEVAEFSNGEVPPAYPPDADYSKVNTQLLGDIDLQDPIFIGLQAGAGSTLWAVNGENSETGLPLLANSPQTIISIPSQWYEIGLHCIEVTPACPYDVVGFSAPGLPLVVAGHNQNIAWGIANSGIDTQDLYMVKRNPENPMQYEYNGAWEDFEIITETINVNDDEPLEWPVYQTRWGMLINDISQQSDYALVLRWEGLSGDWLKMMLGLNRAENWEDFRQALAFYGGAPIQFLYADTQNNIGYQLAGTVPIRAPNHSGLSPVLGDTNRYEWRGFVPFEYLPSVYNPKSGWIGAASQPIVPSEYSAWLQDTLKNEFGIDAVYNFAPSWQPTSHAQRLEELLTTLTLHNTDTFATIQADTQSGFAKQLLPALLELDFSEDETLLKYQEWMAEWDFRNDPHSPHAALFAMWWVALTDSVFNDQLTSTSAQRYALLRLLDNPDSAWWDDVRTEAIVETRDETLKNTFANAIVEAEQEFEVPRAEWRWDELHTAHFVSLPVGNIGVVGVEEFVNRGPVETGGGIDTLNATIWSAAEVNRYEVLTLPSYRLIIDLANFDNSRSIHTTGQSGHPASDHYADMIDLWRTIAYHDMHWDSELIRQDGNAILRLQPDIIEEDS